MSGEPESLMPIPSGFIRRIIDARLGAHVEGRAKMWSEQFGRNADGSANTQLAERIEKEVRRRGAIGKQLDIYEPLRWTALSFGLSAAAGVSVKAVVEKNTAKTAITALVISTALNSVIQLARLIPRYDAGLRGGLETAMAMESYDMSRPCWQGRMQQPSVQMGRA